MKGKKYIVKKKTKGKPAKKEVTRLYKRKDSRIKKALNFTTPNNTKLA